MLSRLLTRKEQLLLFGLAVTITVGALSLYLHDRQAGPQPAGQRQGATPEADAAEPPHPVSAHPPAAPSAVSVPGEEDEAIAVKVAGAVRRPGAYRFGPASRVCDLLEAAGGATEQADLSNINLAARLIDETTLTVPSKLRRNDRQVGTERNPPRYTISGWRPGG